MQCASPAADIAICDQNLLDRRYRPFFGKNATAVNSFENSIVITEIKRAITIGHIRDAKICAPQSAVEALAKLPMTLSSAEV